MKHNYKSGTKDMTNLQVLEAIQFNHKYMSNDRMTTNAPSTSHLTKACYYENIAKKRGISEQEVIDYCNKRDIEDLKDSITVIRKI